MTSRTTYCELHKRKQQCHVLQQRHKTKKNEPSVHETKPELTSLTLNTNREANKQTPGNKAPFLTEPSSENQQPQPLYKTSINQSHQRQEDLQHIFIITNILNFQVK